jgi:GNAT superfamily N-acetyltransferase
VPPECATSPASVAPQGRFLPRHGSAARKGGGAPFIYHDLRRDCVIDTWLHYDGRLLLEFGWHVNHLLAPTRQRIAASARACRLQHQRPDGTSWLWADGHFAANRFPIFPDELWVAEADGEIVGFALIWVCGDLWFLAELFVAPGYQGGGVGMARTFKHARKAGATIKRLITFTFNIMSQGLYIRHGLLPRLPIYLVGADRDVVMLRRQGELAQLDVITWGSRARNIITTSERRHEEWRFSS